MKTSLYLVLVATVSITQAFASADVESAFLTQVKLAKSYKAQAKGLKVGGRISVNRTEKTASFTVHGAPVCKPGIPCPKFLKSIINAVELPVVSETKDSCGARTTTASRDARPVDGNLQTLTIVDNRLSTCFDTTAPKSTFVTYTVTTAGFGGPVQIIQTTAQAGALAPEASETPTTPAFQIAPVQTCSNAQGDAGFRIEDRVGTADIFENNIAGEKQVATVKCKAAKPGPNHPDAIHTSSTCSGKGTDGKSYTVQFKSGGFAGGSWAELGIGKALPQRLSCQFNPQ